MFPLGNILTVNHGICMQHYKSTMILDLRLRNGNVNGDVIFFL